MALSRQQIESLVRAISLTRAEEVACDDCLKELAEFAERRLQGKSIPASLEAIEHHLALCGECREEYEALREAIRDV